MTDPPTRARRERERPEVLNITGTVRAEGKGWRAFVSLVSLSRTTTAEARDVDHPGAAIGLAAKHAWDQRSPAKPKPRRGP